MPFKSKAERGFLFENYPKIAKEFAKATPKGIVLPEHVNNYTKNKTKKGK